MSSYKAPPELNDEKSFKDWKKEIEIWQLATEVNKEKQAAMIFLSLKGKSREAVLELANELTTNMTSEETETVAPHAD